MSERKLITTLNPYPIEKLEALFQDATYEPSIKEIKQFRKETGMSILRCKYGLAIANGNKRDAIDIIYGGKI